jgi:enoyl-CoA hydratase/carnithine racemase
MSEHIKTSTADGILTLVLDRIDKKNALTDAMYAALAAAIEHAEQDPATRVILIRAEGDMFTAGNDVGEFAATATGGGGPRNVARFLRAISTAAKPVVAAVQGRAVGVGTTLLLHCDYIVLSEDAQLITPFVSLALVPEAGSSLLLPSRIGHIRAFAMFAVGEPATAQDALAWGLANRVVPLAELEATAEAFAKRLTKQPLGSLIATKKLMREIDAITTRMDVEGKQFVERLTSAEAQEAFMAFAQRRPADFSKFS